MLEKNLQAKCIKYAKEQGVYNVKIISANRAGIPDLLMCIAGRFIAVEFKQPGKELTNLQIYNISQIVNSGGIAYKVDNYEDFKAIIGVHKKGSAKIEDFLVNKLKNQDKRIFDGELINEMRG